MTSAREATPHLSAEPAAGRGTIDRAGRKPNPQGSQQLPQSPAVHDGRGGGGGGDVGNGVEQDTILRLPVGKLKPSAAQPRQLFDADGLDQLAQSIEHYGVLQPLIVKPLDSGDYEILAGERRWRAAQLAQLKDVPCLVRNTEDDDTLEIALIENIQRRDLTPIEEAQALADLVSYHHYTHEELSSRIGLPRTSVTNALRLLQLPQTVKDKVHAGQLTPGHAKAILTLTEDNERELLASLVTSKGLSVRQTELHAKSMLAAKSSPGDTRPALSPNLRHLCDQYKGHLGTKVKIAGNPERGRIEISYYSHEDLDRITELVLGSRLG